MKKSKFSDSQIIEVTLNIRGNSYRLKEKLKAGLLRPADYTDPQPGGEI